MGAMMDGNWAKNLTISPDDHRDVRSWPYCVASFLLLVAGTELCIRMSADMAWLRLAVVLGSVAVSTRRPAIPVLAIATVLTAFEPFALGRWTGVIFMRRCSCGRVEPLPPELWSLPYPWGSDMSVFSARGWFA